MSGIPASESFVHVDGELRCDGVSLAELADSYGTPAYVYSSRVIERAYREIDQALAFTPHLIAYAVKANGNLAVLRTLARLGSGADIVSGGELARALEAGIPPSRIVYSGVGKTPAEIAEALLVGIRSIHVESEPELEVVEAVARELGKTAKVSLRVNPDVDPQTHPYIATGLHSTKFGIEIDVARRLIPKLVESPHLALEPDACGVVLGQVVQDLDRDTLATADGEADAGQHLIGAEGLVKPGDLKNGYAIRLGQ